MQRVYVATFSKPDETGQLVNYVIEVQAFDREDAMRTVSDHLGDHPITKLFDLGYASKPIIVGNNRY